MENLIRVYYNNVDNEPAVESIVCEKVGSNTYKLIEIPLWSYSLSLGDTISVSDDPLGNGLSFEAFSEFSGNSTVQIVELIKGGIFQIVPKLEEIVGKDNIRFNSSSYIAVNIPAEIDYMPLRLFLKEYESKEIISFTEARLGKNHEYDGCYEQSD